MEVKKGDTGGTYDDSYIEQARWLEKEIEIEKAERLAKQSNSIEYEQAYREKGKNRKDPNESWRHKNRKYN